MYPKHSNSTCCVLLFAFFFVTFAGCKPQVTGSWSTDVTVNGLTKSKRVKDEISRRLERDGKVTIKDGIVSEFPKGAVIKLEETGSPDSRVAELRENADKLELWVKERGSFRRATTEDEAWLKRFLADFASR